MVRLVKGETKSTNPQNPPMSVGEEPLFALGSLPGGYGGHLDVYSSKDSASLCKGGCKIGHFTGRVRVIILTFDYLHVIVRICVKEQT